MNKSEAREVAKVHSIMQAMESLSYTNEYHQECRKNYLSLVARTLATLVRSTRTNKARNEFLALADKYCVRGHTDFVVVRWA